MAWSWASVNFPPIGVALCPLVPKLTNWFGSPRSGRRWKYSLSRRVKSTNISFGAGCPARGEIAMTDCLSRLLKTSLRDGTRLRVPDGGRVLGDGAVAGELSRAGHIHNGLARPGVRVGVQLDQPPVRVQVGLEVRQVHVVVAVRQERVAQGGKDAGFVTA